MNKQLLTKLAQTRLAINHVLRNRMVKRADMVNWTGNNDYTFNNSSAAPVLQFTGNAISQPVSPVETPTIKLKPSTGYSYTTTQVPMDIGSRALIDTLIQNPEYPGLAEQIKGKGFKYNDFTPKSVQEGADITRAFDDARKLTSMGVSAGTYQALNNAKLRGFSDNNAWYGASGRLYPIDNHIVLADANLGTSLHEVGHLGDLWDKLLPIYGRSPLSVIPFTPWYEEMLRAEGAAFNNSETILNRLSKEAPDVTDAMVMPQHYRNALALNTYQYAPTTPFIGGKYASRGQIRDTIRSPEFRNWLKTYNVNPNIGTTLFGRLVDDIQGNAATALSKIHLQTDPNAIPLLDATEDYLLTQGFKPRSDWSTFNLSNRDLAQWADPNYRNELIKLFKTNNWEIPEVLSTGYMRQPVHTGSEDRLFLTDFTKKTKFPYNSIETSPTFYDTVRPAESSVGGVGRMASAGRVLSDLIIPVDAAVRGVRDAVALPEKSDPKYGKMSWAEREARAAYDRAISQGKSHEEAVRDANGMFGTAVVAGAVGGGINRLPQLGLDYTVKAPTDLYNMFQTVKEYAGFTPTYLKSTDPVYGKGMDIDKVSLYNLLGGDVRGSWGQVFNTAGNGVSNLVQIPLNAGYNVFYQMPKDLATGLDPSWAKDQTKYFRPDLRDKFMQQVESAAVKWNPEQQAAVYDELGRQVERVNSAVNRLKYRIEANERRPTRIGKQQIVRDTKQLAQKRLKLDNLLLAQAVLRKHNPNLQYTELPQYISPFREKENQLRQALANTYDAEIKEIQDNIEWEEEHGLDTSFYTSRLQEKLKEKEDILKGKAVRMRDITSEQRDIINELIELTNGSKRDWYYE